MSSPIPGAKLHSAMGCRQTVYYLKWRTQHLPTQKMLQIELSVSNIRGMFVRVVHYRIVSSTNLRELRSTQTALSVNGYAPKQFSTASGPTYPSRKKRLFSVLMAQGFEHGAYHFAIVALV